MSWKDRGYWYSACTASIVRVVAFDQVKNEDITYTIVTASIWTTIEQSMGIICACLPTTRIIFDRLLRNSLRSTGSDGDQRKELHSSVMSLSHYKSHTGTHGSADATRDGFARLSEESRMVVGSVTAQASKAAETDLPYVPNRIVRQQRLEQRVDDYP